MALTMWMLDPNGVDDYCDDGRELGLPCSFWSEGMYGLLESAGSYY